MKDDKDDNSQSLRLPGDEVEDAILLPPPAADPAVQDDGLPGPVEGHPLAPAPAARLQPGQPVPHPGHHPHVEQVGALARGARARRPCAGFPPSFLSCQFCRAVGSPGPARAGVVGGGGRLEVGVDMAGQGSLAAEPQPATGDYAGEGLAGDVAGHVVAQPGARGGDGTKDLAARPATGNRAGDVHGLRGC